MEGSALPEVLLRVTEARTLLDTGAAQTEEAAAERVGISLSAYLKYKNSVMPFRELGSARIATFQLMLQDRLGVLSAVLELFAGTGANILTINQGIPVGGTAPVTITASLISCTLPAGELLGRMEAVDGVVSAALAAG